MSRLTDRLERDLGQIADRATPSTNAWDSIRQRIEVEADEPEMEIIMLSPNQNEPTRTRRWLPIAAAAAAVALIGGLVFAATSGDDDTVVDRPEPTVPDDRPEPEAEVAPAPDDDPEVAAPEPDAGAEIVDDADGAAAESGVGELPFPGQTIDAGAYTTELLGGTLSFELPQSFGLVTATTNRVLMIDSPEPVAAVGSRAISFSRISGWNTPEESVDTSFVGPGSIDPYDLDGWLADERLIVSDRESGGVAGRVAQSVTVEPAPASAPEDVLCGRTAPCFWVSSLSRAEYGEAQRHQESVVTEGEVSRFWIVTVAGSGRGVGDDPLVIQADTSPDDTDWFDEVEATTIASLGFEVGSDEIGAVSGPSGLDLPPAGSFADPARYVTDLLGVEMAFDLPIASQVAGARANYLALGSSLTPPDFDPEGGVVIEMMRHAGWSTAEEALAPDLDAASLDPFDIDGWIESNGVELLDDRTIDVAGRESRVVDAQVDPTLELRIPNCEAEWAPCFYYNSIAGDAGNRRVTWVTGQQVQRFYLVPIGDTEPLLIRVSGPEQWFDMVETSLIEGLELGPDVPPAGS